MKQLACLGIYPIWLIFRFKIDNFVIGIGADWSKDVDIVDAIVRVGPIFIDLVIGKKPDYAE
ncbi:hypothetical protein LCGC14_1993330 [marine sediment metagenome]|uniref:Uncharacterized protein n=1 Tax=marine sediment metagenome TaxID=412755 RepID=A0A0F9FTE9_9ZZZZ